LTLDAHRFRAEFFNSRRVQPAHPVGLPQFPAYVPSQFLLQGMRRPGRLADKVLQTPSLAVIMVGNRLDILARRIREQTAQVDPYVRSGVASAKGGYKRMGKLFQTLQHAFRDLRLDLSGLQYFTFSNLVTSLHGNSFPWGQFPWKVNRNKDLHNFNVFGQYK
jgi:hypothetical protein